MPESTHRPPGPVERIREVIVNRTQGMLYWLRDNPKHGNDVEESSAGLSLWLKIAAAANVDGGSLGSFVRAHQEGAAIRDGLVEVTEHARGERVLTTRTVTAAKESKMDDEQAVTIACDLAGQAAPPTLTINAHGLLVTLNRIESQLQVLGAKLFAPTPALGAKPEGAVPKALSKVIAPAVDDCVMVARQIEHKLAELHKRL